jgi:hypothetical protein
MRATRAFATLVLVVAGHLALPRAARADVHSWTLCTTSTLNSCHSLSLMTSPTFSGTTRVGTYVTITMHNLNGQIAQDNTLWSGLLQAYFFQSPYAGSLFADDQTSPGGAALTLSGGATGSANGTAEYTTSPLAAPPYAFATWYGYDGANYQMVGGCTPGTFVGIGTTTALTCGANALASFSFSSSAILDAATGPWVAYVAVLGDAGNGVTEDYCFSDPNNTGGIYSGSEQCNVLSETVTSGVAPEPVSMVLLGSGLIGLGGARLRRKKADAAA